MPKGIRFAARVIMWVIIVVALVILAIGGTIFICRAVTASNAEIKTENGISEELYVDIGGIKQYFQIRGQDTTNPIILFLHGGPGGNNSYISTSFQMGLEDAYTVVQWDQRGCGRTYYKNPDMSVDDITVDKLMSDIGEINDYLCDRFEQDKIIIMGYSWGTILGSEYVKQHPEKVSAYVGVAQVINTLDGEVMALSEAAKRADAKGSADDAQKLRDYAAAYEKLTDYSQFDINTMMAERALSGKYLTPSGQISSIAQLWLGITSPYMTQTDLNWFTMSPDSLFNAQTGIERHLAEYMFFGYDAYASGTKYSVPVYFISGESDWVAPVELVNNYYTELSAPTKCIAYVKNSGHTVPFDFPEQFVKAVKSMLSN